VISPDQGRIRRLWLSAPGGLILVPRRKAPVMADIGNDRRIPDVDAFPVRVLTVRQPHAHLLIHGSQNAGFKDVENRSKPTRHRGTLLIQASAKVDQAAYAEYLADGVELPPAEDLVTGAIIGSVEVTGCVRDSRSRWAEPGYWHWLTASPRAANPVIPVTGQLAMFAPPDGWEASFRRRDD
jgi:hypothetical protein